MRPTLARLTWLHLRVGNLTFGGGDPTMSALQAELVARYGWLAPEKYGLIYALARVTPGTNLLAFCAGAAWQLLGWRAAVLAVAAVSLPSAVVVLLLTQGFDAVQGNRGAMAAVVGTLAAAVGMMAAGAWLLAGRRLLSRRWKRALVFVAGAVALSLAGLSPVPVLALAAVGGALWREP